MIIFKVNEFIFREMFSVSLFIDTKWQAVNVHIKCIYLSRHK